jgi:hypothetical protein
MVLLHDIIEIFHLPDADGGAVCLVVAFDGGFIGVTAVNRDRFGEPVAADRLLQKPQRGLCVPVLGEQKVNALAVFIHRPLQIAPLPLHLDVRLVHPPAHPHRTLAPMEGLLELRAIFDDPPVNGGVIHVDPTFLHEFFDMARAQGVGDIPADSHENNVLREMGPFEADRHRLSPPSLHGLEGETIPQIALNENLRQNLSPLRKG